MTERFELLEQLGKGGMGTVWKARDTDTGEFVALKLLHEQYADDPYFLDRFQREVEVTRRVQSPHVVRMVGYGVREGRPYVAMEYVEGRTLRDILRERGKLDWPEAKALLRQVALGLAAAHAVGVVHRDVKPSNILVTGDGTAKLVDFGIAKAADLTALTGTHTMLGTTGYMAPEGKATPQADLYALGCVAYEILTGAPPFEGETPAEVLVKHIRETPDLAKVPEGARAVVGWLLAKDGSARPASAEVLVAALDGSHSGPIAHSTVGGTGGRGASNRRKVALFGGIPLMVLLAGAGAAFALSGGDDQQPPSSADSTTTPEAVSPTSDWTATPTLTASPTSAPTATPVPPTATPVPPTAAPVPPTATPVPPTVTPVPPTATPVPPTATPVPPTATPVPRIIESYSVKVQASSPSNVLNVALQSGDEVSISASGTWYYGVEGFGPEGDPKHACSCPGARLKGHARLLLLGQVGTSGPFIVGSSSSFVVQADGFLDLFANAESMTAYGYNTGSLTAVITVTRRASSSAAGVGNSVPMVLPAR